jgi:hypothetical protein
LTQLLPLLGEILDGLGDLDTVEGGGPQLFILNHQVVVDVFKLANMLGQLADHLVRTAKLFRELALLTFLAEFLPSGEGSENGGQIVVVKLGESKSLTLDEVLQEIVSLNVKMVNGLVHPLDPTLGTSDQVLIRHNLVDQLFFGKTIEHLLRIGLLILPFLEVDGQRVIKAIQNQPGVLLHSLSGLDPFFPLVKGFRNDVKVSVLEEEANHCLLHVGSLGLGLGGQVLIDLLR